MKVKRIKKLPRLCRLPKGLDKKLYRDLQAGRDIKINDSVGNELIDLGLVVVVAEDKIQNKKKDGE